MLQSKKTQAQQIFGQYAKNYVDSPTHASGYSLERLIELLPLEADWRVLDAATGGGHTALRCLQPGIKITASDLTLPMLKAARAFHQDRTDQPLNYVQHDAEALPFATASFEVVTCRIAAHHFPKPEFFIQEAARVLKPGGWLGMVDIISSEQSKVARYCNLFETLRDRSHVWAYSLVDWEHFYTKAGLVARHIERVTAPQYVGIWAKRVGCDDLTLHRLRAILLNAPTPVREWYQISAEIGWTPALDIAFSIQQAIMIAQKPSA